MPLVALANRVKVQTNTSGPGTITLGFPFGGFRDFNAAGVPTNSYVNYVIEDGNNWEVGQGNYTFGTATPGTSTLTRATIFASSAAGAAISLSGAATVAIAPTMETFTAYGAPNPQGRLTGITATPLMTGAALTAGTTVFYTPYVGSMTTVWDGAKFVPLLFTETSQLLTDTLKSPSAAAASMCYDMFGWLDYSTSGTQVYRVTRGPAWTSGATAGTINTRGQGAGSTQLARNNGVLVNAFAIANGPAANTGVYLGTIATNAAGSLSWSSGGAAAGGSPAILSVWNMYNRVDQAAYVNDTTGSHVGTAAVRQYNGNANNRISVVTGVAEDLFEIGVTTSFGVSSANNLVQIGIALNQVATLNYTARSNSTAIVNADTLTKSVMIREQENALLGFNYFQFMENAPAACTFNDLAGETYMYARSRM